MRERAEKWTCPICGGDGFVLDDQGDAVACECRQTRIRRARAQGVSSVVPRKYRGVSFERAPISGLSVDVVRPVQVFVRNIAKNISEGHGLWFEGDVGTGKTALAMLVSQAALKEGLSVAIYSVPHLLAKIRDTYDSANPDRSYVRFFRQLTNVDLLHLDDMGAQKQTDWVLEQLYSLVNERYENERSIMITTNLALAGLEEQIGKRTVSRLIEMTDQIPIYGGDLRGGFDSKRSAVG